jgi:hypothetical protein
MTVWTKGRSGTFPSLILTGRARNVPIKLGSAGPEVLTAASAALPAKPAR